MRRIFFTLLFLALAANVHAFILAGVLGPAVATTGNPPNAVTDLAVTVGDTKNTLTWSAPLADGTHDGATTYNLLWGTVSGSLGNTITGVTSPYQHSPLTNGISYYYMLAAGNASGSSLTAQIGPYTPAVQPPNAPVMTASAGDTKVTYTWSAPAVDATHSAATSYNLRWGTVSGSLGTTVTGVTSPYDLTGRTNGVPIYAKLDALNAGGTTSQASEVSATPVASTTYTATFDGTSGTAPDTSFFTVMTAGSGAATLDGSGNLFIRGAASGTDGALVYRTNAVVYNSTKVYKVRVKTNTTQVAVGAGGDAIQLIHAPSKQAPLGSGNDNSINGIEWPIMNASGSLNTWVRYIDNNGNGYELGPSGVWVAAGSVAGAVLTNDTYYWYYIYTTPTGWSAQLRNAADSADIISKTNEIAWSATKTPAGGESMWLRMGDKYSYAWQFGEYIDTYTEQ